MGNLIKVVDVSEVKTASDGRQYFVVSFSPGAFQKPVKRTMWQQFKRDKDGALTDVTYWERSTPEDARKLLKSGELIEGRKITRTVETYTIGENDVNQYSTVMFPDENEITLFNSSGHPIVDTTTGELVKPVKAVISAPEAEEEEEEEVEEIEEKAPAKKATPSAKKR
jgi:ornithine cyclodeaminase/alanine dehydrogenase-like protein (mu-crystallin family)